VRAHARIAVCVASVGLGLSLLASGCGHPKAMPSPGVTGGAPPLRVLAFYDDRAEKPRGSILPLIAANHAAITDLAPLWYSVMADGTLRDQSENDVKAFARDKHIRLMPLVINAKGTSDFLLQAGACTTGPCGRAVDNLAALLRRESYDGLNIDFELLKPEARAGLTAFVRQLHARTQALHKVLTIDVIPAGNRRQAEAAYDFAALAANSDDVVLMTYDAHDDSSKAGPIAPLAWVRQRAHVALQLGVPPTKLILGLADYGYDWTSPNHATTIPLKQAEALSSARGIKVQRTADGEPHFTYSKNGVEHTVWYEDGRGILPKIKLARQMHLKGLALWMAGYETAQYWHSLRAGAGTLTTTGAYSGSVASQVATTQATKASATAQSATRPAHSAGAPAGAAASAPSRASTSSSTPTPSRSGASASSSSS